VPFAVLVVTLLGGGLVGLLLLNTSLQRGAYVVTDLQQTSDRLTIAQQNLETEVAQLQAPQRISERALRLGMVVGDSPAFLSLETGRIVGVPKAGQPSARPNIAVATGSTGLTGSSPTRAADKQLPVFSGEAASQTTGVTRKRDPDLVRRDGGNVPAAERTNTSSPRGASDENDASRDTKNTSNTGPHQ
jgi:hypothetical protein